MELRKLMVIGATAGLISGLAACGSGDSGGVALVSGAKYISGPITAFGSVYVNGARYNTDNATVYVENNMASESELRVGMMVTVKESSNGSAAEIHFDDDLEGYVISSDVGIDGIGVMNVMGQEVTITTDTIFESKVDLITDVAGVSEGNVVEVSGYSTGTGAITATRLEVKAVSLTDYLKDHTNGVEVKGVVAAHSEGSHTFTIGSLTVNYAGATLDDMPVGNWDGLYVEAKSRLELNSQNQLVAFKVELEDDGAKGKHGDEDDEVEVYGEVTAVTGTTVTVNGQTFQLDVSLEYEHGGRADLIAGAMIKLEAYVNNAGQLVAKEIEFADDESQNKELKGYVSTIDHSDTNVGTIEIDGAGFQINNSTIMHDDRDENGATPDTHFNLSKLSVGEYIEVHYVTNGDGTFTATKLEREDPL